MRIEDEDFRNSSWRDDDDSDSGAEWSEDPDDSDDETETVSCPKCGIDVYEDAPQCPLCGEYLTPNHSVWSGRPVWFTLLAVTGIVAVIVTLVLLGF